MMIPETVALTGGVSIGPGDALSSDCGPEIDLSRVSRVKSTLIESIVPSASEDAFSHSLEMSVMLIAKLSMSS